MTGRPVAVLRGCVGTAIWAIAPAHAQHPVEQVMPAPALTPPEADAAAPKDGLTGGWGGLRKSLRDDGVVIAVNHVAQLAHNASGGSRSRVTLAGQLSVAANLDLEQIAAWRETKGRVNFTYRHGDDIGARAEFATLLPIQEIYGRGRIVRLTEAWIEREVSSRLTVRAGRMPVGDFATFTCDFQNLSLCGAQPGHTVYDYWLTFPIGQWGAWARYGAGKGPYVQLGAYQVSKHNVDKDPVEFGSFTHASGVLLPAELTFAPRFGDRRGSYKIGGWYDTTRAEGILAGPGAATRRRTGRHGGYVSILQELLRDRAAVSEGARTLSAFLHVTKADERTAIIDFQLTAGLFLKGAFASRPSDLVGLGFAESRSNQLLAAFQRQVDAGSAQYSERLVELFYRAQVHPAIAIQPGIQYLSRPGGLRRQRDVIAPTLKVATTF